MTSLRPPAGMLCGSVHSGLTSLAISLPNQESFRVTAGIGGGWSATNAAITFAFLGGAASLVNGLGVHALAAVARDIGERQRSSCIDLAEDPSAPPTLSSICVHEATGTGPSSPANAKAPSASVDKFDPRVLSGAKILLVDGHHMQACTPQPKRLAMPGSRWFWTEEVEGADGRSLCPSSISRSARKTLQRRSICTIWEYRNRHHARPQIHLVVNRRLQPLRSSSESDKPKRHLGSRGHLHGAFCWAHASGSDHSRLEFASGVATESCLHYGTRSCDVTSRLQS